MIEVALNIGARDLWADPATFVLARRYEIIPVIGTMWFLWLRTKQRHTLSADALRSAYLSLLCSPLLIGLLAPQGPYFPYLGDQYGGGLLTLLDGGRSLRAILGFFLFLHPAFLVLAGIAAAESAWSRWRESLLLPRLLLVGALYVFDDLWLRGF